MNFIKALKPRKPYVMGSGKPNKYHPTRLDGHRVLPNGSIVVRTISVGGKGVDENYDKEMQARYESDLKAYRKLLDK